MKKFYRYFALVLVIGLMIFAGCSKEAADLQTVPIENTEKALSTSNYSELKSSKVFYYNILVFYYSDF